MKKTLSFLFAFVLALAFAAVPAFAASAPRQDYQGKTVVLYTGNIRGNLDIYAQIKHVKDNYEANGARVLLVDAGNYLQGSAAANTDRGLSVYELMDAVGYDAAAMGLAEFGYADAVTGYPYHNNVTRYYTQAMLQLGTEAVSYSVGREGSETARLPARQPARFRAVSSNATALKEDVYAFEPSASFTTQDGLKVVFWGVTDPAAAQNVQDGYLSVSGEAPVEDTGADVNIVLSNGGLTGDNVISAPTGGEFTAGALVIDNQTHAITREAIVLDAADPDIAALADRAKQNASKTVGTSGVILNGADHVNRNGESNLGDLAADALAWYAANHIDGIDKSLPIVAIQNGGNCDSFLYTGDITEVDLLEALPFSPMGIGVLQVTGAQLLEAIEAGAQCDGSAGFAQVSGLTYIVNKGVDYDGGAAYGNFFVADSITRVTITSVGGEEFDPGAVYNLVCDNFLMNGSDTYYTLKAAKEAEGARYVNNGGGVKTRDAVAMYIADELDGVVDRRYAGPQGRITVLDFEDVPAGVWYTAPVGWAVARGVTTGTSGDSFSPGQDCTMAEILTFLWRAAGEPETEGENPFDGVKETDFFYKALLWANALGMVEPDGFNPHAPCTRAQTVSFLWQAAGRPEAGARSFDDVPDGADYAAAVSWAVERGITDGTGAGAFSPDNVCTRAQVVTFLYRSQDEPASA